MEKAHDREGDKALLFYNIVRGPELADATDPSGKTTFVLTEVYASQAGVYH